MSFANEYDDRYFRVDSQADWEKMLDVVAGFHDGVVREVALRDERYVGADLSMSFGDGCGAEASVVVQFQRRETPALELVFMGVQELQFSLVQEADSAAANWNLEVRTFTFLTCAVKARRCAYRVLDASHLGPEPQFWSREDRPGLGPIG